MWGLYYFTFTPLSLYDVGPSFSHVHFPLKGFRLEGEKDEHSQLHVMDSLDYLPLT